MVGGAEPQRAAQGSAGPEAQRTLEQMGNTTPPLGGVNKSVSNFEGTLQRAATTDRQGGRMRPRECAPEVPQPGCEGDRAVAALSPTSGPMAGVGRGLWGAPPRTQRTQTQPAGGWRPTEQGAPRRSPRGAGGPSRCALHREERGGSDGAVGLILPGGTSLSSPSRIILERINYEIVN